MIDREQLDSMLQDCLAAYESGVPPRDCLSAFPEHAAELEPLLRQALSLRVAFAASPSEEFRKQARGHILFAAGNEAKAAFEVKPSTEFVRSARERFMFAAGRDAVRALDSKPSEVFVASARDRFLHAAGASTQEALRAVPPPRLTFWVNARRRLLEAAANPAPQRRQVSAPSMTFALRTGLSTAVIVLAVAVSGLAYMASQDRPGAVTAERAYIQLEQDITLVEAQVRSGELIPAEVIIELSKRTSELSQKLSEQPAAAPVAEKLPEIILRQQAVVSQASVVNTTAPELQQATLNLVQAEQNVRLFAAAVTPVAPPPTQTDEPQPTPTTQPAAVVEPTTVPVTVPTVQPTAAPAATSVPSVPATPAPLLAGQIRATLLADDHLYGLDWMRIETIDISFDIPTNWKIPGVAFSATGVGSVGGNTLRLDSPDGSIFVIVSLKTGLTQAITPTSVQAINLRSEGPDGQPISTGTLVTLAGDSTPALYRLIESIELTAPATPSATPAPSATPMPPPPTPSATTTP